MKVRYKIFDEDGYNSYCSMISDLYPNDPAPSIEEYTKRGTGEVIKFIKGRLWREDRFLVADDETGEFIKLRVSQCKKYFES